MDPLDRLDDLYRSASTAGDAAGMADWREDLLFAKLLIRHRIVEASRVLECVDLQERAMRTDSHPVPRLGDLLVKRGYASRERLHESLGNAGKAPADEPLPADIAGAKERFGKFILVRLLGRGGMGDVYLAWDTDLARRVALKFVKLHTPEDRARFRREAQLAAKLSHPNIAAVYEVGDTPDGWIAMQYIEGRTLDQVGRADRRTLATLVRDAAKAIHYAHTQGVIHRDLKPANIMVEGDRVFVLDFGLAKRSDAPTSLSFSGQVIGTPAYMPPEQARGEVSSILPQSDVYSLGATLYHLLGGAPPFTGEVYDILVKVANDEPRPLRLLDPRTPRDLQVIVAKAMEKEPARRYATAAELADDLDRWLAGEPITARPASVIYRFTRSLKKHRAIAAVALVALACAGAAAGWGLTKSSALSEERRLQALREKVLDVLKPASDALDRCEFDGRLLGPEGHDLVHAAVRDARAIHATSADIALMEGRIEMEEGHEKLAAEHFDRAIADPALAFLGHYYRARARLVLYLREAAPPSVQAIAGLSFVSFLPTDADPAELKGLREAGLEDLRKLEELGPLGSREPRIDYGRAVAELFRRSDPASAAKRIEEALKSGRVPRREALFLAGLGWLMAKRPADAVQCLEGGQLPGFAGATILGVARMLLSEELERRGQDATALLDEAIRGLEAAAERTRDPGRRVATLGNAGAAIGSRARIAAERGQDPSPLFARALALFDQAAQLDPDDEYILNGRGLVLAQMAERLAQKGEEAESLFRRAIEDLRRGAGKERAGSLSAINEADTRSMLGGWMARRGRDGAVEIEEAIAIFTTTLERDPTVVPHARFMRGNAYLRLMDCDERRGLDPSEHGRRALEDFDAAIAWRPDSAPYWANRAAVHGTLARFRMGTGKDPSEAIEAALKDLSKAVELQPKAPIAWNNRGIGYLRRAQWKSRKKEPIESDAKAAIDDFTQAIKIDAGYVPAWRNRGSILDTLASDLARRGVEDAVPTWKRAIEDTKKALEMAPSDPENCYNLGVSRLKLGEHLLGRMQDGTGELRAAIEDFTAAIALNPKHAAACANRGTSNFYLMQFEAALADLKRAVELQPGMEPRLSSMMEECRKQLRK